MEQLEREPEPLSEEKCTVTCRRRLVLYVTSAPFLCEGEHTELDPGVVIHAPRVQHWEELTLKAESYRNHVTQVQSRRRRQRGVKHSADLVL